MHKDIVVCVAMECHAHFAQQICDEMAASAQARGTGIARRSPEYIVHKMLEGKAVIAFTKDDTWAGFCYIETWGHGAYVANSGLIVAPEFRKSGLARQIKQLVFELSRKNYPDARVFGLTTGLAVMKINSELGYEPVTYSELTNDDAFWAGCKSCVNYDILLKKERKNCLCTAMLFDPADHHLPEETQAFFNEKMPVFERLLRFRQTVFNSIFKKGLTAKSPANKKEVAITQEFK
ncbi:MAG: GNAT family N-acetyltransferase [Bacteroidia bacterium]|jgi:GNAT superfamily N-acetyltransferase